MVECLRQGGGFDHLDGEGACCHKCQPLFKLIITTWQVIERI